jgi:hypothetical protein
VLLKFGTQHDLTPVASAAFGNSDHVSGRVGAAPAAQPEASDDSLNIDWLSVGLGLLALIAVGGLVPFWMWIYFVYNPPVK